MDLTKLTEGQIAKLDTETHVSYNKLEKTMTIFTANVNEANDLISKGYKLDKKKSTKNEWFFCVPKKYLTFRTIEKVENPELIKPKRTLSEAHKSKLHKGKENARKNKHKED